MFFTYITSAMAFMNGQWQVSLVGDLILHSHHTGDFTRNSYKMLVPTVKSCVGNKSSYCNSNKVGRIVLDFLFYSF